MSGTVIHPNQGRISGRKIPFGSQSGTVAEGDHTHASPIDDTQTPTAETVTPSHTIIVTIDGTDYKIPVVEA